MTRADRARRRLVLDAIAWHDADRAATEARRARGPGRAATLSTPELVAGLAERRALDRLRRSVEQARAEGVSE